MSVFQKIRMEAGIRFLIQVMAQVTMASGIGGAPNVLMSTAIQSDIHAMQIRITEVIDSSPGKHVFIPQYKRYSFGSVLYFTQVQRSTGVRSLV
jgi:hypothetical protein